MKGGRDLSLGNWNVNSKVNEADPCDGLSFNERELKVICTMSDDPQLNDSQASSIAGMNHSTFLSVKKRLEERGAIRKIMVPTYLFQEGDVLFLGLDHSQKGGWKDVDENDLWSRKCGSIMEVLDEDIHISINVFRDFRDLYSGKDSWEPILSRMGGNVQTETQEMVCREVHFLNLLDHSGIACTLGGTNVERQPREFRIQGIDTPIGPDLKEVLDHLIKNPSTPLVALSERIGINRQTLSRFKKYCLEENLMVPTLMINPVAMGFNIMGVFLLHFDEGVSGERFELLRRINMENRDRIFFNMVSMNSQVILTYNRDFRDFKDGVKKLMSLYMEDDIFLKPPVITPITLDQSRNYWLP